MEIHNTREAIIARRGYRENIKGDQYSLYLSSYPIAVEYLAGRLENKGKIVAELCSSVGVTLEAIASKFEKLIGVEINPEVLEYCRQNLKAAGLMNKVTLIQGDISDESLLQSIQADVVIYDIPYWFSGESSDGINLQSKNPDLVEILGKIRRYITDDIVVFAPPYLEYDSIRNTVGECEFQKIYINDRYDRNYIFFGSLLERPGITEKRLEYGVR
jgi:16S rRNA G966 N2-methylase RsmD